MLYSRWTKVIFNVYEANVFDDFTHKDPDDLIRINTRLLVIVFYFGGDPTIDDMNLCADLALTVLAFLIKPIRKFIILDYHNHFNNGNNN